MVDQTGIRFADGRCIRWDEIAAVSAYKIDAISKTLTYLVLDYEYGEFLEIDGEDDEFPAVMAALDRFLDIPDGWRARLEAATPADDILQLWRRSGESGS